MTLLDMDRATPTPSECEEDSDLHREVWFFWLLVQFKHVSKKVYKKTAASFDRCPVASAYFRELCHYDLVINQRGLFELRLGIYESGPYE